MSHKDWCSTQRVIPPGELAECGPCNCGANVKDITMHNLVHTLLIAKSKNVKKTLWRVTRTDTFGDKWSGNYSWRRDVEFSLPATAKRQAVVKRIKAEYGLTNMKCDTQMIGETIAISPRDNTVIFAEPEYE